MPSSAGSSTLCQHPVSREVQIVARSSHGSLRNGYRGRFGMYLPPLLEQLGLAELTHDKRGNKMRAAR